MKSRKLLEIVATWLRNEHGQVWVHAHGAKDFGELDFPVHHVSIGGWYPDLLTLRDLDYVVAVVVCGEGDDYLAGLGRSLSFRHGAHFVFLAGELGRMREFREVALANNVGVLTVGPDERIDVQLGGLTSPPRQHDVRRELEILSNRSVRRRFTSLAFEHPVHFLAPIMAIRPEAPQSKQDVATLIMERWGFTGPRTEAWWSCLYGALFLGLVREPPSGQEVLALSELGDHVRNGLLVRYTAAELRGLVNKASPLIKLAPDVALLLRGLYLAEPDVALVVRILRGLEPTGFGIEKLILRTMQVHPNAGINLFFRTEEHERVLECVRGARFRELFEPTYARNALIPGVFGAFKKQLIHLGFVRPESPTWEDHSKYDPGQDLWVPGA